MKKFWATLALTWLVIFFVCAFTLAVLGDHVHIHHEWSVTFIVLACSGMLIGLFGSLISKNEMKSH